MIRKSLVLLLLLWMIPGHVLAESSQMILTVPKLNLQVTVGIGQEWSTATWTDDVVRLDTSANFGSEKFSMVIMGHTPGLFSPIIDLQAGDIIYLQQGDYRITYQVTYQQLINDPKWLSAMIATKEPELILVTCTEWETVRLIIHAVPVLTERIPYGYG